MISINRVYKTVLTLANTDIRGNVTPAEIRNHINQVVNDIYEEYFFELNRSINRENKGLTSGSLANLTNKIREKLQHFLSEDEITITNGIAELPSDLRYLESVFYGNEEIDILKNKREFNIVKQYASETYPVGYRKENALIIEPYSEDSEIEITYLRNPKIANWTYRMINNAEVFDPSSPQFQDIDLHPSEESNVIIKTLNLCGVNLNNQELQAFTSRKENKDFNEEITS